MADTGNNTTSLPAAAGNNSHGASTKQNTKRGSSANTGGSATTSGQRSTGSSSARVSGPHHRGKQKTSGVSALMLRDMEELRGLSIGSPEPTPRPDDFDEFQITDEDSTLSGGSEIFNETGNRSSSSSPFPAITVERCEPRTTDTGETTPPSRREAEDSRRLDSNGDEIGSG